MTYRYIYKITNLLNGMIYVGQHTTSNLDDGYMGSSGWLRRSIKKHGKENFKKEIQGFYEDADELNYMERCIVDQTFVSRSDTYNLMLGGKSPGQMTEEHKRKIGLANKGRVFSKEARLHMSQAQKGKPSKLKGRHLSEEHKKKLSGQNHWDQRGEKNPMFGKSLKDVMAPEKYQALLIKRRKPRLNKRRPVSQYTKDGAFVATFSGIIEAKQKTGIGHIDTVARGERKYAGGYIWRYD